MGSIPAASRRPARSPRLGRASPPGWLGPRPLGGKNPRGCHGGHRPGGGGHAPGDGAGVADQEKKAEAEEGRGGSERGAEASERSGAGSGSEGCSGSAIGRRRSTERSASAGCGTRSRPRAGGGGVSPGGHRSGGADHETHLAPGPSNLGPANRAGGFTESGERCCESQIRSRPTFCTSRGMRSRGECERVTQPTTTSRSDFSDLDRDQARGRARGDGTGAAGRRSEVGRVLEQDGVALRCSSSAICSEEATSTCQVRGRSRLPRGRRPPGR